MSVHQVISYVMQIYANTEIPFLILSAKMSMQCMDFDMKVAISGLKSIESLLLHSQSTLQQETGIILDHLNPASYSALSQHFGVEQKPYAARDSSLYSLLELLKKIVRKLTQIQAQERAGNQNPTICSSLQVAKLFIQLTELQMAIQQAEVKSG